MRRNNMYSGGGGILEEFKSAFYRPNNAVIQLIFINLAIFLVLLVAEVVLKLSQAEGIYATIVSYLMMPSDIGKFLTQPWTLITYFFTHTGFLHILFNMLFLYWFGKLIQEFLGSDKVISLYVLGGIFGGLTFLLIYNLLPFFSDRVASSMMLGASAGVYAIVVGAATFMPNYTFYLLLLGPIRIKYIAIFYVIMSFANTTGNNAGGELAHLGGALIGFIYIKQLQQGNDWGAWITSTIDSIKSMFSKKEKIRVTYKKKESSKWSTYTSSNFSKSATSAGTRSKSSKVSQDEIDHILDKISDSGYESLSKEEKEKLFNASKS
ncbi:MAG: rhomboid family intramembrane serine protease [Candidatus Cyclobacteriaceae bacterium M2_1C_046]